MKIFIADMVGCKKPYLGYQIKATFEKMGHDTKAFDYRAFKLQHLPITNKLLNSLLINQAKSWKADLVMVHKGETVLPGTVDMLKKDGIKVVNWNPDEPFGVLQAFNKLNNIGEYDAFFTYDTQYLKPLKELNPNTYLLPAAADPFGLNKEQIPLKERTYPADVCMVGTAYPNRISLLSKFPDYSMKLAGPGWNKAPKFLSEKSLPYADIFKMVKMFNESKIVLNPYGAEKGFIVPNPRTFEIPATRSFELTDIPREVENYFIPKKEIVVYKDDNDFKELVDYYLENDEERTKIAQAGYNRVVKEHTLTHRLTKMLDIVKRLD